MYICDACVAQARNVISSGPVPGGPFVPVIMMPERGRPDGEPKAKLACSFCGKQLHQVDGLAASSASPALPSASPAHAHASAAPAPASAARGLTPRAAVCTECLDLCDEIIAEDASANPSST